MKDLYISDFADGQYVSTQLAVQRREFKTAKNGSEYLTATLADRTGTIEAVMFSVGSLQPGIQQDSIVEVSGTIGQFSGKPQIVLSGCSLFAGIVELADFIPASKISSEELWAALTKYVEMVPDDNVRRLLNHILTDPEIDHGLRQSPAGIKVHHCVVGGLLEHIVSMAGVAWRLCNHYKRLDRSLLIAGCILHDIGKIQELTVGVTFGYSKVGQLIGHVTLGCQLIERFASAIPDFPEDTKLMLQHLVLSHHGEIDHGAVKVPMTPEAIALSQIDGLDARLDQAYRLIDAAPTTDEFTAFVPSVGRCFYAARPLPATEAAGVAA